jgi:hypothetical protein
VVGAIREDVGTKLGGAANKGEGATKLGGAANEVEGAKRGRKAEEVYKL